MPKPKGSLRSRSIEADQNVRGERVLRAIQAEASPTRVIGEDLGVIPPFVRKTLTAHRHPWLPRPAVGERQRRLPRPQALSGRERGDLEHARHGRPSCSWWDELPEEDRAELARLAGLDAEAAADEEARWLPLMRLLLGSASELTLVLPQEILGEHARINTPGHGRGRQLDLQAPSRRSRTSRRTRRWRCACRPSASSFERVGADR